MKDDTEELIKETAKRMCFAEGRFHATTQEIADEAKVNRTLINYYFRSRNNLISIIYEEATQEIRSKVNQGISLTSGMVATDLFPNMMVQMASIGEESGALDDMLNKAAEFYEDEVDNAVSQLSSLMEPIIMVVLGGIVGVILVAMYLPLFNLGDVVG